MAPTAVAVQPLGPIEACPRKWALGHAQYPDVWDGRGYPDRPAIGAIAGRVAHLAIEKITQVLDDGQPPTFEAAVGHLRALGGISQVIGLCTADELVRLRRNPRSRNRCDALAVELQRRIPDLRLIVQSALNRALEPTDLQAPPQKRTAHGRTALGYGYHPEVELLPANLNWVGYADAIRLTESACEIIDYKTGSPSPVHEEQLRIYALLWARDLTANPQHRLATRLAVVYSASTHEAVAPNPAELAALETALKARSEAARDAVAGPVPLANVAADQCRYCDVKHLCRDYWSARGQSELADVTPPRLRSIQGVLTGTRSEAVAEMTVELDPYLATGTAVIVTRLDHHRVTLGQRVRLIDVQVIEDPDTGSSIVALSALSEIYVVAPGEVSRAES
jgi:hypothetical protein